jgi:hypothetical protein
MGCKRKINLKQNKMGFFSWNASNTGKSIANSYSKKRTFTVAMVDDKNNIWIEPNYEGYGEFGGKDFYELLAQMNGLKTREQGIDIAFCEDKDKYIYPCLYQVKDGKIPRWKHYFGGPESCDFQGFFY